jgi:2-polyprenyl-3-methyl-5-hydroxy-6-metoxy-1,4-benzoquinol methylase
VLDVGTGVGNVAIPAAATGAEVVTSNLTPELFDPGRRAAAARGCDWRGWRPTPRRCPSPFADDEFDVVTSAVGVIFAPDHQAVADELLRICRPGGVIGIPAGTVAAS